VIVYPWEQEKKAQTLGERLGALGTRANIVGTAGFPVAIAYRVAAKGLPDAQNPLTALARGGAFIQPQKVERAVWGDQMELLGYSIDAADTAKRNLEVILFLHALEPMSDDYTFSVKVRDEKDRVWGQEDKWAGDSSYATTQWSVGDVVIEKFYPGLNACAPAGDYRITVEAYDPKTMQVLALADRNSHAVELGTTRADASPSNRLEDLEPEQTLDAEVAPQAHLLGMTLTPKEARAGDPFSLSLFWRGVGDGTTTRRVSIRMGSVTLVEKNITLPTDGRGLCTLFDLQVPRDIAPGASPVFVNDVKVSTLNVSR
jgi:hypothetical protein